jgi:hypothetical protein
MDGRNFDALTRAAAAATSRRGTFGMIAGAALMAGLTKLDLAGARKKGKGKGKNKKKKCRKLNQGCGGKKKCCKGLSCTDGTCLKPVPEPECENNADCNSGEICQNGICVPEPPECENDNDCGNNEICDDGECIPEPPECVNDNDCSAIEICQNGQCVPEPPECNSDSDCDGNELCEGGFCLCPFEVGGECVIQCLNASGCPGACNNCRDVFPDTGGASVCVDEPFNLCIDAIGCDQVAECPAGFLCASVDCGDDGGRCYPITCDA